jgi:hypothetical protein
MVRRLSYLSTELQTRRHQSVITLWQRYAKRRSALLRKRENDMSTNENK